MKKSLVISLMMCFMAVLSSCEKQNDSQAAEESQPVEFFKMINVGDKLDACVAKGYIESSNPSDLTWKLTDENLLEYFPYTTVKFDSNNEVQEIELKASNMYYVQSSSNVDVERSFNYILKYFTKRYTDMKRGEIAEEVAHIYDQGTEFSWDTPQLAIIVKFYESKHDNAICNTISKGALGNWCADRDIRCGTYTHVTITRK